MTPITTYTPVTPSREEDADGINGPRSRRPSSSPTRRLLRVGVDGVGTDAVPHTVPKRGLPGERDRVSALREADVDREDAVLQVSKPTRPRSTRVSVGPLLQVDGRDEVREMGFAGGLVCGRVGTSWSGPRGRVTGVPRPPPGVVPPSPPVSLRGWKTERSLGSLSGTSVGTRLVERPLDSAHLPEGGVPTGLSERTERSGDERLVREMGYVR